MAHNFADSQVDFLVEDSFPKQARAVVVVICVSRNQCDGGHIFKACVCAGLTKRALILAMETLGIIHMLV